MLKLRRSGLSLAQIGERLGVSRQRVQFVLKLTGNIRVVPIHCRECRKEITQLRTVANHNRALWCLACLAKHPKATFGQRLKAHRLAAGLTLAALGQRTGIAKSLIGSYECDRSEPRWRTLAKLIRVLGIGLVDVE
jgi:transcriptional regulator with XRE-family HTH domain